VLKNGIEKKVIAWVLEGVRRGKCWTKLPRCVEKNYARGEDVGIFFFNLLEL